MHKKSRIKWGKLLLAVILAIQPVCYTACSAMQVHANHAAVSPQAINIQEVQQPTEHTEALDIFTPDIIEESDIDLNLSSEIFQDPIEEEFTDEELALEEDPNPEVEWEFETEADLENEPEPEGEQEPEAGLENDLDRQLLGMPIGLLAAPATPATLTGEKTATKVAGTSDIFRVDLDISGADGNDTLAGAPADVVVVLDMSGTMDDNSGYRWRKAQQALNDLADGLLKPSSGHQLAIVGYSSQQYLGPNAARLKSEAAHRTICDFTSNITSFKNSYSNATTAVGLISSTGVVKGSGTNSYAGFWGAKQLLEAREGNGRHKFVIFITDGFANTHYVRTSPTYDEQYLVVDPLNPNAVNDTTVGVANQVKNLATIFSVGVDLNLFDPATTSRCENLLDRAATDAATGSFTVTADGLSTVVTNIMNALKDTPIKVTHGTVSLNDTMSQYVSYQPSYGITAYQSSNNGVSWNTFTGTDQPYFSNGVLKWDIQNFSPNLKYRVSYYVKLNPEHYGKKIHKNNSDGANPTAGTDGVIANGDTYLSSDAITRQTVLVPTVYVPKLVTTPPTLTGHKTKQEIAGENGVYDITVTISGTPEIQDLDGVKTYKEQTNVLLVDPMSAYVDYGNNVRLQMADKGGSNWSTITGGVSMNTSGTILFWRIPNFSSAKQYRIIYQVTVKEAYAGVFMHKEQSRGGSPTPGTDGVIANNYTYVYSDQVTQTEILVPAVKRDKITTAPATLEATKTASAEAAPGLFTITLDIQGTQQITSTNGTLSYVEQQNVFLTDPMSSYVDYKGNASLQEADKDQDNWSPIPSSPNYNTETRTLTWLIPNYSSSKQYRVMYQVQVLEEYYGARLHENPTYGSAPDTGTDGVVANGRTTLSSNLVSEKEIQVPVVYADRKIITPPALTGLKTSSHVSGTTNQYDISLLIQGEKQTSTGYGGPSQEEHSDVQVNDPMSQYVSYIGNPQQFVAQEGSGNWQPYAEGTHTFENNTLQWNLINFSSDNDYMLVYRVEIKDEWIGQLLHKEQTSGRNPEPGDDGVVANGYTYASSSLVPDQEILVPTVGAQRDIITPASMTGTKTAAPVEGETNLFQITAEIKGNPKKTVHPDNSQEIEEHTNVTLTDPMSAYVDYEGDLHVERALRGTESWGPASGTAQYDSESRTLSWKVQDYSSDYKYRMVYKVSIKQEYWGAMLHQGPTHGDNPATGTDGVIANDYTFVSSDLMTNDTELLVPTVYTPYVAIEGTLDGKKTAQQEGSDNKFKISVLVTGTDRKILGYQGPFYDDHNLVTLEDSMSQYVNYLGSAEAFIADKDTEDWEPISSPILDFNEATNHLQWVIIEFAEAKQYLLTYYVEVKPEYHGMVFHKDQTDGRQPEAGSDGLVANGFTYLSSELVNMQNVLVPTVYKALPSYPVIFKKVDGQDLPLTGVQFELYACTKSADPEHVHDLLAAPDSCWDLEHPVSASSDDDGWVDFGNVSIGDYMLVETKALEGFALPSGQWLIQVDEQGFTVTGRYEADVPPPLFRYIAEGEYYMVANYAYDSLPTTGGGGILLQTFVGITGLMTALLAYRLKRFRKARASPAAAGGTKTDFVGNTGLSGRQTIKHIFSKKQYKGEKNEK